MTIQGWEPSGRGLMRSRQVSPSKNRAVRNPIRPAWLWAIGNSLKAEYDAVATPLPSHLAALVEQIETQKEELPAEVCCSD